MIKFLINEINFKDKYLFNIFVETLKKYSLKFYILLLFYLTFSINNNFLDRIKIKKNNLNYNNLNFFNQYYLNENSKINGYLNIAHINYFFSFKYRILKIEYNIGFYNFDNNNLIIPTELLYNNFNIFCHIKTKNNLDIYSLPNIYLNKYFNCIEFFDLNEEIRLGFKIIYKNDENIEYDYSYFFLIKKFLYYNDLTLIKDYKFSKMFVNNIYNSLHKKFNIKNINETLRLQKSFLNYPYSSLKRFVSIFDNNWVFKNIYNHHFCFCKGQNCLNSTINNYCKFYFYLNIIDKNRKVYPKTNYLFMDFIFEDLSADDTYPVFKQMARKGFPVHYITEKSDIYNEYCGKIKRCLTILSVRKEHNPINGNFLEKFLIVFLKLKAVITGRGTTFNTNFFYNIEYITYICVGHGLCYFKYYLYSENRIYGIKKNDKILLPPSEPIISIAKKYGWKDKDIIRMNFPRWDKYINGDKTLFYSHDNIIIRNNSIIIMFTWRDKLRSKEISSFYLKNLDDLINNEKLNNKIQDNKITLYLSFHRLIDKKYIKKYKIISQKKNYIKFIDQNEISECLSKANLAVTDFSSIIFDLIFRKKPFIIYIPDADDPNIKDIYTSDYFGLIESMKKKEIKFENVFINISEAIGKIIFYIDRNFKLDLKLEKLYESLGFKNESSINKFINYLTKIK